MMNCKHCGGQLEDNVTICPACGIDNSNQEVELSETGCDGTEEITEEKELKKAAKKIEKINVNAPVEPVKYTDIGNRSQVAVSFSDGSTMCMKKIIAQSLYPQIFEVSEGGD